MIKVNNIFKSFKEVDVLKNVTFNFEKGAIVGFLGPNGAGKSTLIKIMTGIMSPDKGTIYINNYFNAATQSPVGGYKQSGYGRENGWEGMRCFMQTKSVWLSTNPNQPSPF